MGWMGYAKVPTRGEGNALQRAVRVLEASARNDAPPERPLGSARNDNLGHHFAGFLVNSEQVRRRLPAARLPGRLRA